jgi:teichoic acid transport system permease protein
MGITDQGLMSLSGPVKLREYIPQLLGSRELAYSVASNDLRNRNGSFALGWLWNILDPLLMLAVYGLVFGVLLAGRRPENFVAFLAIGIFLFRFVQSTVTNGANALRKSVGMIRQVRFPRAVLPLAETLRNLLTLFWQMPVVAIIVVASLGRISTGWVPFLVLLVPLLAVFSLGGALALARVNHAVSDATKFFPYAFRILFYTSGVLFPISAVLEGHPLLPWLPINPIYSFISLGRHLTLAPIDGALTLWLSVSIWSVVAITLGMRVFVAAEHRYGRG